MDDAETQKINAFLSTVDKTTFSTQSFAKRVQKPWGYEILFAQEGLPYTSKVMHIEAGKRISLQVHDEKRETQVLIKGKAKIILENEKGELEEIDMISYTGYTNIPGQQHRVVAIEDSDVFESSMPEMGNTFRIQDDYKRSTETEEMRKTPNRGWNGK